MSQSLPTHHVVSNDSLVFHLKPNIKGQFKTGDKNAQTIMANYFREKFKERYFYDYDKFTQRFEKYKEIYPSQEKHHKAKASEHLNKFNATTPWKLPFSYLYDEPVDAYNIRHLARQHRMVDIGYTYFYSGQDPEYLNYFTEQVSSLNKALELRDYERTADGNGVYESFRSGYRILNWLAVHNMMLSQESYSDEEQLHTIATLAQHASHLYAGNPHFRPGNHQTRGMSALAMLSIILSDFEDADKWFSRSIEILQEHLDREINEDDFQFERTVHYHISDIENYYYVLRLAQISGIELPDKWISKMEGLFKTLAKIAYPDKSAPVLQDDTDKPWAEKNDISKTMSLGYVLFNDPVLGYFAENRVEAKMFWVLSDAQLNMLENIKTQKPTYGSLSFEETGYYIMREGWEKSNKMMIISAGLDAEKPDHQHGDMLGVQAISNEKIVLPNYQVRYSLKDLELFKNSMTKNVALVDDFLQGKDYSSNQGGSGFGKFNKLPNPEVITWNTTDDFDLFIGRHDGFEENGVDYTRQVIYVKPDFWIVKDNFKDFNKEHIYKQVWQGHFTTELGPQLLRSSFDNGSGLDILQLNRVNDFTQDGQRGKSWTVVNSKRETKFSFLSVLYPFDSYNQRIDETKPEEFGSWKTQGSEIELSGEEAKMIYRNSAYYLFLVDQINFSSHSLKFNNTVDLFLSTINKNEIELRSLFPEVFTVEFNDVSHQVQPGESLKLFLN